MESNREGSRQIRLLSIALVAVVMTLALLLMVAVCTRRVVEKGPEETTKRSFWELLGNVPFDPGDLTLDPDWWETTGEPQHTEPREPVTKPLEPAATLEPWESGLEWPTLPPTPDPNEWVEWPSLPEGWDTLPSEWDTLPSEWEADSPDPDDIPENLVGAGGDIRRPGGALGAGIAAGLTVLEIKAEIDDRLYLKMKSFGDYAGQGWAEEPPYSIDGFAGISVEFIPHLLMDQITPFSGYALTVDPVMDLRVSTYYPVTVEGGDADDRPYGIWYRPYDTHVHAPLAGAPLDEAEGAYAAFVRENYLYLDDTTRAYMELVIRTEGFESDDPDIVDLVADYVKNAATYNLSYNHNLDNEPNVALAFLGAYREGVCRHFASAATLLYRALGIPARYTVGFMADVTGGETTAVKGKDAHAWVEIYEEGFGWRFVEVTGSSASADPDQPPYETETETESGIPSLYSWGEVLAGVDGRLLGSSSIPDAMKNTLIFTVMGQTDAHHLLKIKSFGDFLGDGWRDTADFLKTSPHAESPGLLTGTLLGYMGEAPGFMDLYSPLGTVAIPYYTQSAGGSLQVTDTRVTGDGRAEYSVLYYPYTDYFGGFPDGSADEQMTLELLEYELAYREFVYGIYLSVDGAVADYLSNCFIVNGLNVHEGTMQERIGAFVRGCAVYDPDCSTVLKNDLDYMRAFMGGNGVGNSRHFATVATLLYRAMGIPARYTVGYETYTYEGEEVDVRGSDAYAWVEIYVDGYGWMPVDVTGRTEEGEEPHPPRFRVQLTPVYVEKKFDGDLAYHTGELTGLEEFEALGYTYEAKVYGSRHMAGVSQTSITAVTIYDPQGRDVTEQFSIRTSKGFLRVYYEKLEFVGGDILMPYLGNIPPLLPVSLASGELPEGCRYKIVAVCPYDRVGVWEATYTVSIVSPYGDETEYYSITTAFGTIEVLPLALTLKAQDAEKPYDGTPLTAQGYEILSGALAPGDSITVCEVEGSRTQVGRTDNVITRVVIRNEAGEDVTANYEIKTEVGVLKVTR